MPAQAEEPAPAPAPTRTPREVVSPSQPSRVEIELTPDVADAAARYRGTDPVEREAALSEIAGSGEAGALAFLIDELSRAQGEQRRTLLQAVIDFGSRAAIPELLELAEASADPEAKAALVEAAEYLALPTLKEFRQGKRPSDASP
ncbi:MAG: HEAT repeat domain-containing protein [Myxococcota bacterium]